MRLPRKLAEIAHRRGWIASPPYTYTSIWFGPGQHDQPDEATTYIAELPDMTIEWDRKTGEATFVIEPDPSHPMLWRNPDIAKETAADG